MITGINSSQEFNKQIKENEKVFVCFSAKWCGVCRASYPVVEKLSKEIADTKFLKIDVDNEDLSDIVSFYGISSIPCHILFKNGEKIDQFKGLKNAEEIKEKLS